MHPQSRSDPGASEGRCFVQHRYHLLVGQLMEVIVKAADAGKNLRLQHAHEVVDNCTHPGRCAARRNRNCQDDLCGALLPKRLDRDTRRRPCSKAIVDHDGGLANRIGTIAIPKIERPAPLNFFQFFRCFSQQIVAASACFLQHRFVYYDSRRLPVAHRRQGKLRMSLHTDFSHQRKVEGSIEFASDLQRDRNTAARKGVDDSGGAPPATKALGKTSPSLSPVGKMDVVGHLSYTIRVATDWP